MFLKHKNMKKITLLLLLLCCFFSSYAQKKVYAASYGLIPNTNQDCTPYLNKIFETIQNEPEIELIISAGDYHFYEEKAKHSTLVQSSVKQSMKSSIVLKNLQNVHIDANFASFIFHGAVQPFLFENCSNIKIRNLFVDFATPTLAEAEVVDVNETYFSIRLDSTLFPFTIRNNQLVFKMGNHLFKPFGFVEFNVDHNIVQPQTGDRIWYQNRVKLDSMGFIRVYHGDRSQFPKQGNWIVIRHGYGDHPGFLIHNSDHIVLQNINIYQTAGVAIRAQNSKNLSFYSCSIVPYFSNNRKFLSSHEGGMEFIACKGMIRIDNCETFALMGDAVKIAGTYAKITKRDRYKMKVTVPLPQIKHLDWAKEGETIAFVDPKTLITYSTAIIKKIKKRGFQNYDITFENPLPSTIQVGMVVENLAAYPDVVIQNSRFRSGSGRGLVLNGSGKILIESNIFETSGSAILFAGDAIQTFESGPVDQVLIRKNIFRYSCLTSLYPSSEAVISIFPNMGELNPDYPYHSNIRIENNNFFLFDYPVLYAKSVKGILFINNTLYRSNEFTPFHPNRFGVKLVGCKEAVVGNNKEIGEILGKNVVIEQMDPSEVNKKNNQ